MYRQRSLTISANTELATPAEIKFTVPAGQIQQVTVEFPQGCHGWVYCQLLQGNEPILPDEPDVGIRGNAVTLQLPLIYDIERGRNELTIRGWSPGAEKAHTITVGVAVLSEIERTKQEEYLREIMGDIERISKLLGV